MASLIQLAAVGGQDADILVNPQRTFFRSRYKRHTPFAMEPRKIRMDGGFGYGQTVSATIPRSGDMLARLYLVVDLGKLDHNTGPVSATTGNVSGASSETESAAVPTYQTWHENSTERVVYGGEHPIKRYVDDVGKAFMEYITLEMGSVKYDTIWPEYAHAWEELCLPHEKQLGRLHLKSLGNVSKLTQWGCNDIRLYIPLEFWFHSGGFENALPLVSMHLTDVKITGKIRRKDGLISPVSLPVSDQDKQYMSVTADGKTWENTKEFKKDDIKGEMLKEFTVTDKDAQLHDVFLLGEYIFLDDPERELIAKTQHEFLIHQIQRQVQFVPQDATSSTISMRFNHPTKELMVLGRSIAARDDRKEIFNFNGQCKGKYYLDAFQSMSILLNNSARVDDMDPTYFSYVQPFQHHTRIPEKKVYVYSFAKDPEDWRPSGSLNLSRIENADIELSFGTKTAEPSEILVFARSMNIVKIFAGITSLRWSS